MNANPKITIEPVTEIDGTLTGYLVTVEQHGLTITLSEVRRRLVPEEPAHATLSRALLEAAGWCSVGEIDLRDAGQIGAFQRVART